MEGICMTRNYWGKAKCSCGKRAKFKDSVKGQYRFSCRDHRPEDIDIGIDRREDHYTEADFQTWNRG